MVLDRSIDYKFVLIINFCNFSEVIKIFIIKGTMS